MLKETYLAILKRMRSQHPNAKFIVVTRTAGSILSPTWKLLNRAKKEAWSFEHYKFHFIRQIRQDHIAMEKLLKIKKLATDNEVYLVCYEKDPSKCHRSILIEMINGL